MESTSCLLALKPSYYTIIVQYTIFNVHPGNNRLPRSGTLARGNTHFPHIYFPHTSDLARGKHPHSAHLYLARSVYYLIPSSGGYPLTIMRPCLHYPDSDQYGGWPKQAHKSLYIQRISTALLSCAVDQSPAFPNNTIDTSDHH